MHRILHFESKSLLSHASLSLNSNSKMVIPLHSSLSLLKPTNLSLPNPKPSIPFSVWKQTHRQISITCARHNRRRNGYQRSRKLVFEFVYFVASNLRVLPEPLALAIREFGGGNGGGIGFWKGFGGEGFEGWRRKRKNKLGFVGFLIFCGFGMWLVLGGKLDDTDVVLGFLGFFLFGVSINGWKRGFKDWILGFCFCAVLVGLGLRRENLQRWANKGFGAMGTLGRKNGRRA